MSGKNELEILSGLRPGLVRNLARLHGQDLADIQVTVQVMPYGDRAVLYAYRAIDRAQRPNVLPLMADLVEEAFQVVLRAVNERDIMRAISNRLA